VPQTSSTAPAGPSQRIVAEVERIGYRAAHNDWTLVPQWDLRQINRDFQLQVRDSEHQAPKETVEDYAVAMDYNAFEPIVVTRDGCLVDGYTRSGAAESRHHYFLPAIVLQIDYGTATPKQKAELRALGATLNAQNGLRLTDLEVRKNAANMLSLGWTNEQISRALQLKSAEITSLKQELEAKARLQKLDIDGRKLKAATLRAMGKAPAIDLFDEPYETLVNLAMDAGFNANEVTSTAKTLKDLTSEASQIERVAELREEMAERIREHALTGVVRYPEASRLRQALGNIVKYAEDPLVCIEYNEDKVEEYIEMLRVSINVLQAVLTEQETRRPLSNGYSPHLVEAAADENGLEQDTDEDESEDA